ncbi:hypothetical protein K491DRAFT_343061 [Lophiostoma macrostomum CBS 122681]|uniref:Uncharacterized protein n=1 Tax=Lophiostoma macrostomum CBS 122681 TaxID=1314788 RepID=A0A6A6TF50_9PLEO|nr:hypothetical protein K491DRAFT_343061 [Lophiostoma macrostomum CBS 122681]
MTQSDLSQLRFLLRSCAAQLVHPLTIPEIFLHMIVVHLNERIRVPGENDFYMEERRTGLARVKLDSPNKQKSIWTWNFQDFQNSMAVANKFLPTLAYLQRRFAYATQLTQRLLSVLEELKNVEFVRPEMKAKVDFGALERRERLLNRMGILENYSHQTECMLQRTENTITVLSTTLNQIDSRNQAEVAKGNLHIAHAVRTDSIPMRTIAYVTLIVLPGAFVAAIFGMNFFLFDPDKKSVIVADTFWQYWAVTVPLTIFVLIIWNIWVRFERNKPMIVIEDEESLTVGRSSKAQHTYVE